MHRCDVTFQVSSNHLSPETVTVSKMTDSSQAPGQACCQPRQARPLPASTVLIWKCSVNLADSDVGPGRPFKSEFFLVFHWDAEIDSKDQNLDQWPASPAGCSQSSHEANLHLFGNILAVDDIFCSQFYHDAIDRRGQTLSDSTVDSNSCQRVVLVLESAVTALAADANTSTKQGLVAWGLLPLQWVTLYKY